MKCIFCKIADGEIPAEKLYQDAEFIAFRDINPAAKSHILVIPRKHISTLNDLTPADTELIGRWLLTAQKVAKQEGLAEDGYRIVMNCNQNGGQEVFHIHLHILGGERIGPLNQRS